MIQINKTRRFEIKYTVLKALSSLEDVKLPIPIKALVQKQNNCRLIRYSLQMQTYGLSYQEQLDFAGTADAYTDYDAKRNRYIICYNDVDQSRITSNRFRWSIAHELGHVLLGHHKNNENARLFRNKLSESEYRVLEDEADLFASYILCPYAILLDYHPKGDRSIATACNISSTAARYRYRDYKLWAKHWKQGSKDSYDFQIRWLYTHKKQCTNCGADIKDFDYNFCPICGKRSFLYIKEDSKMIYNGVPIDENGRITECPRCENEEIIPDSSYCHICGMGVKNTCCGEYDDCLNQYEGPCKKSQEHPLPSNARFCPYCGAPTTFSLVLPDWRDEFNSSKSELPF